MKTHILILSAIVLLSVLQGANAATMEDKPMATEMQQPMQPSGTETMTKPMAADETQKSMMPATERKGAMGAEKQTPMMDTKKKSMHSNTMMKSTKTEPAAPVMEQDKNGTTMRTMKQETMKP